MDSRNISQEEEYSTIENCIQTLIRLNFLSTFHQHCIPLSLSQFRRRMIQRPVMVADVHLTASQAFHHPFQPVPQRTVALDGKGGPSKTACIHIVPNECLERVQPADRGPTAAGGIPYPQG